jgi:small-conductance mechanosensitive channel
MTNLYSWLRFLHLLGLAAFLISHGVTAGAALALRGPASPASRGLLRLSLVSGAVAFPALLLLIVSGVWMAFARHLWGQGWIWASIVVFVAIVVAMGLIANRYRAARDAAKESDEVLGERLGQTRPIAAIWIGSIGLLVLLFLMVFKPF